MISEQEMNMPSDCSSAIGENSAVPTVAVSDNEIKQIGEVARWYADSSIIPTLPDVNAGVAQLKLHSDSKCIHW